MLHHGDIEPVTRRSKANAQRVQLVIHALSDKFTGEPFPAMSDHYRVPGVIGSVMLPHEYQPELPLEHPHLTQPLDAEGLLKTELNRWIDRD